MALTDLFIQRPGRRCSPKFDGRYLVSLVSRFGLAAITGAAEATDATLAGVEEYEVSVFEVPS